MPSSRESFKLILTKNLPKNVGDTFSSRPINVEGRDKTTFLVYYDNSGSPAATCDMTIEWSFDGKTMWLPLANISNIAVTQGLARRITIDDRLTYVRVIVSTFSANGGNISAWNISL